MDSMDDAAIVKHVLNNRSSYYRVLFVERNATADQIKVAYKKMALRCHPDKNKHSSASEAFKLVGTANATLSDPTKRRIYDTQGAQGVQQHESAGGRGRGHGGAAARHPYNRPNDIFEEFFGRHAAILLQSTLTDVSDYQDPRVNRHDGKVNKFSLAPDPAQGLVVERVTSQNGLRVKYYVHRTWAERASRGYADVRRMERDVLQQQRESLARRCEAESLSYRARGKKDTPPVCSDYEAFRRATR